MLIGGSKAVDPAGGPWMPEGGGKAERQRTQNVTYRTLSTIGQKLRRPVFFAH